MAVDMFLDLEGIKGESADDKYKDKCDVLAFSWGMSQSGTTHQGTGGGSGKANFQDISFTKYIDKASPDLMFACASGKHIAKGQVIVRKAGATPLDYYVIKLQDIIVSSVSTGGSSGEERLTENITLNFAQFTVDYNTQSKTGAKEATTSCGWSISQNKKL